MKFSVKGSELTKKLKSVIKGYDNKDDGSYVAFDLSAKDTLTLTSRSRSIFFEAKVSVDGVKLVEGEQLMYYVDGTTLSQLTAILPSTPVDVSFEINDSKSQFKIKYTGNTFTLPVISDFQTQEVKDAQVIYEISANEMIPALRDLRKIVNLDQSAQESPMSCINVAMKEDSIVFAGTDSQAFGRIVVPASYVGTNDFEESVVLIHQTVLNALIGTFNANETLEIVQNEDKSMFGYYDEDKTLTLVSVVDMTPLEYDLILSQLESESSVIVSRTEFKEAIDTIGKLSFGDSTIYLTAELDKGYITLKNDRLNEIKVTATGTELEQGVIFTCANNVLSEALAPISTKDVKISWGSKSPALRVVPVITTEKTDENGKKLGKTQLEIQNVLACAVIFERKYV